MGVHGRTWAYMGVAYIGVHWRTLAFIRRATQASPKMSGWCRTTEERRTVSLRVRGSSAAVASISVVLPQEKQLMKTTPRKVPRLRRHSTQRLSNLHGTGTTSIQAINSIRINRRIDKGSPLRDTFSRRLRKDSSNSYSKKSTKAKSNSTKNGCSCDGNADDIAATQKDDLEQCLNDLEELKNSTSTPTPSYLFVQMADRCIFEKDDEDGASIVSILLRISPRH